MGHIIEERERTFVVTWRIKLITSNKEKNQVAENPPMMVNHREGGKN